ncbi:hypothetical protein [Neobacillus cucumis]|uniref:magnesium chelatase subunit ChlI family protein n=1 Tax=Neobacillus cucumis TaxID=1740721 RepID=UPI0035A92CCE
MPQQLAIQRNCNWSNRTHIKILRIARTIADLQGSPAITGQTIQEAIHLNGDSTICNLTTVK